MAEISGIRTFAQVFPATYFDAGDYVVRTWMSEQGLPQNSANAIIQTRDGYLWVATDLGLARFDGIDFQVFNSWNNGYGLLSSLIWSLYEDQSGALWIGTEGGLSKYEDRVFSAFTTADGLAHNAVYAISEDRHGSLWIGTRGGLSRYADGRFATYTTRDGLPHSTIHTLYRDRRGTLWIGTEGGLARFDGQTFSVPFGFPETAVHAITEGWDGALWVGTEDGIFRYADGVITRLLPDLIRGAIFALCIDREGALWLGMDTDRLVRYSFTEGDLTSYPAGSEEHRGPVLSLLKDREGSLWAGTSGYGLLQFQRKVITHITTEEGLAHNLVRPILEDRFGSIWIGTRGGYLHRLRDGEVTTFMEADGLPGTSLLSLAEGPAGTLWAGTFEGPIVRIEESGFESLPLDETFPVHALYVDQHRKLWIGTENQGLYTLSGDSLMHFTVEDGLPHPTVRAILEAPPGTLWFGTDGGLVRYRNGTFQAFTEADGLSDEHVAGLSVDFDTKDLTLWIGTAGGGITRFKNGTFSMCDVPMIPLDDGRGYLWTHHGNTLYRVSKQELHDCADGKIAEVRLQVFGKEVGLRGEANSGFQPVAWRSRDGRLWFPTTMGAAVVDPARIEMNTSPPPVVIEQVLVENDPAPLDEPVVLEPGQRQLTVHYTGLSFTAPERVRFKYKLEGLDHEWVEAETRRWAHYSHVPPGNYLFRVKAAGSAGIWNEAGTSLRISIRPYFYQTRLFLAFCILAIFVFGLGLYRLRIRHHKIQEKVLRRLVRERTRELVAEKQKTEEQAQRLAALDEAKSRFFANISHEFRTPLTLIIGPLKGLLDGRYGATRKAVRQQHEIMLRNSQRLLRLINQVLDLSKIEAGRLTLDSCPQDLVPFVQHIVTAFMPLAERRHIRLTFHTACRYCIVAYDADQLEKVLLNLLSNALKFTEAGDTVQVSLVLTGDSAEIMVRDTGMGIAADKLPHIFDRFYQVDGSAMRAHEGTGVGLALVKELIELHGGSIGVESTPGVGSTFTVRLPLEHARTISGASVEDGGEESGSSISAPQAQVLEEAQVLEAEMPLAEDLLLLTPADHGGSSDIPDDLPAHHVHTGIDRTTVLVVDDNPDVRTYVRSILEPAFGVLEASNGANGLERAREALPDLIVADVMMPQLDGFGLCRALKADPMTDCIPVILLTARAATEDQVEGLHTGADDYVTKPFEPDVLRARVAGLIASRQQLRERLSRNGQHGQQRVDRPVASQSPLEMRLRQIIEAHLTEPAFNPAALADEAALSYKQLYRRLRDELGVSPTQFIRIVRVERAARLLEEQTGTISEIAYAVGFNSLSYFNRSFREHFGMAPSEYMHRLKI